MNPAALSATPGSVRLFYAFRPAGKKEKKKRRSRCWSPGPLGWAPSSPRYAICMLRILDQSQRPLRHFGTVAIATWFSSLPTFQRVSYTAGDFSLVDTQTPWREEKDPQRHHLMHQSLLHLLLHLHPIRPASPRANGDLASRHHHLCGGSDSLYTHRSFRQDRKRAGTLLCFDASIASLNRGQTWDAKDQNNVVNGLLSYF